MNLDTLFEMKKFFMRIYKPIIGDGNNLKDNEQILLCYKYSYKDEEGKGQTAVTSKGYNNIDELIKAVANDKRTTYLDTYFCLSTSNNDDRKTDNMQTRTVLGFDFDNCTSIDYVQSKFKEVGLFYNIAINSGNGIHAYICIESTKNIELVDKVTKAIVEKIGSDLGACKPTQILRIPWTFNCKDRKKFKRVRAIHIEGETTVKRKNINILAKKLLNNNISYENKTIKFTSNCRRAEELIANGSKDHEKHNDLLFLYSKLKQMNVSEGQLRLSLDKWNSKSNYSEFEYQVKDLMKRDSFKMSCAECKYKSECYSVVASDFEYQEYETTISTNEKIFSKCKKKGAKQMNGNMLVIYGLLKLHTKGLTKEEIIDEMTFRDKKKEIINVAMSDKTLRTNLKEMEEKKFIKVGVIGQKKLYQLSNEKAEEQLKFIVRASVVFDVIKGYMTQEELQFYCFLRYLQNEQRRLTPSIKGNQFIMTQEEIAKKYGVTRQYVNELIGELERKKYIRKEYRQSNDNGFEYCNYYLVH